VCARREEDQEEEDYIVKPADSPHFRNGAGTGSAISSFQSEYVVEDSDLSNNYALRSGGAIRSVADPSVTIIRTDLSRNRSNEGGAVFSANSNLVIAESTIADNYATSTGGGLRLTGQNHYTVDIRDCFIGDNGALVEGAGIYIGVDVFRLDR
jgi:S1-C subfamily serine protease